MQIRLIRFNDEENPSSVTVEATQSEVSFMVRWFGHHAPLSTEPGKRLMSALSTAATTPQAVQLTLDVPAVALIARSLGDTSPAGRDEFCEGGGVLGSEIYNCLTGSFFNRFWDNGVDEV